MGEVSGDEEREKTEGAIFFPAKKKIPRLKQIDLG